MTETQFLHIVEETLAAIEAACETASEESGVEIDCSRAGHVLNLEFEDGGKVVINAQAPMQQLWLAARSGALHFAYSDGRWLDTRGGTEFFDALSRAVTEQAGTDIRLAP
jgi:CyaY protein